MSVFDGWLFWGFAFKTKQIKAFFVRELLIHEQYNSVVPMDLIWDKLENKALTINFQRYVS